MKKFNVINTDTKERVLESKTESEIADYFGLSVGYIISAADKGAPIQWKYILEPARDKEKTPSNSIPTTLWKEWDEICNLAHLVKTKKAHIISKYVNGKWNRYTEVHI